jgi:hypothetical protein
MSENKEFVVAMSVFVVCLALFFAVCMWLRGEACASSAEKMGLEHDYGPLMGCMVKTDRGWFPLSSVRNEQ